MDNIKINSFINTRIHKKYVNGEMVFYSTRKFETYYFYKGAWGNDVGCP